MDIGLLMTRAATSRVINVGREKFHFRVTFLVVHVASHETRMRKTASAHVLLLVYIHPFKIGLWLGTCEG